MSPDSAFPPHPTLDQFLPQAIAIVFTMILFIQPLLTLIRDIFLELNKFMNSDAWRLSLFLPPEG